MKVRGVITPPSVSSQGVLRSTDFLFYDFVLLHVECFLKILQLIDFLWNVSAPPLYYKDNSLKWFGPGKKLLLLPTEYFHLRKRIAKVYMSEFYVCLFQGVRVAQSYTYVLGAKWTSTERFYRWLLLVQSGLWVRFWQFIFIQVFNTLKLESVCFSTFTSFV